MFGESCISDTECKLTDEKGYVLYSSLGSFYIPLAIIIFVYIKIWKNMRSRIRKRAEASGLNALKKTAGEDEGSGREVTTTGLPLTSKCKLFMRRENGSTKSSCDDRKQITIDRSIKEDAVKDIKHTNIPLISTTNSNDIIQEQEEKENENSQQNKSEVIIYFHIKKFK